jgi:hypothetical protein
MYDACNTANAVVPILVRKKDANGKAVLGEEAWAALPKEQRSLGDWLCGNHTRGLPVDAFNRNFEACLVAQLGEEFSEAQIGGKSRLEKSGVALLRSTCKLIHGGWGARAKGDGKEFKQCLWLPWRGAVCTVP